MSGKTIGEDCCGDRYACDTTIKCECGCGLCYCRSCYERHIVQHVEAGLKARAIVASWSGDPSKAVEVLNCVRAAFGIAPAGKPPVQQEILGSTEGPGRGL